jgi:hypothetical protein
LEYPVKRGGGLADAGSCIARHMVDGPGPDTQPVKFVKKKTNIMDINNQQKAMIIEGQDRRETSDITALIYIEKHPHEVSSRITALRPQISTECYCEDNPIFEQTMWFWAGMSYAIEQIISGRMGLQEISIEEKEQDNV